jgi:carboxypeptidase C (cathepsin A)
MMRCGLRAAVMLGLAGWMVSLPVLADEAPKPSAEKPQEKPEKDDNAILALLPADSVTQHKLQLDNQRLSYTATAGTLPLCDEKGERSALVFYVAYTLQGVPAANRPVSFFFNGGPGAASAYLHLGAAGPSALEFPSGNPADGAAGRLKDNPDTWLGFTDMVFIDAIGTGWSRPAKAADAPHEFWGVKQDAQAFAKVVALWLGKNGRSASPKYLVGESYGGIRSIKVARELQSQQGVILDGIVMISPAISIGSSGDNPLENAFVLPSLAAGSLERHQEFSASAVEDAYKFALGPYLSTEVGPMPEGDAAKSFYQKLAELTGVPEPVVEKERGRINATSHDVLSQDGRLMSMYDASLTILDPFPEGSDTSNDPVLDGFSRAYGSAFVGYAADVLGYRTELTYKLLAMDVNSKWEWGSDGSPMPDATDDLRRLLAIDPSLKVFIAGGYFDLVVPFESNRWLVDHLPVGRDRITLKTYLGGHMLYSKAASRAALKADVAALYPAVQP